MVNMFLRLTVCVSGFQDKLLRFPNDLSTDNYLIMKPDFSAVQREISICSWLKIDFDYTPYSSRFAAPWFSYAVEADYDFPDNTILFGVEYFIIVNSAGRRYGMLMPITIMRDEWYHFCFTWKFGSADVYVNGVSVLFDEQRDVRGQIPLGGTLVLGQDQDGLGWFGVYEQGGSFAGN